MKRVILIVICVFLFGGSTAYGGVSSSDLKAVYVDARSDAALPLHQSFRDERGARRTLGQVLDNRPAVLVFADYTCTNLCGPILAFAAGGLEKSGLRPGSDYHLVVVGIDAKDGLDAARQMKRSRIGTGTPLSAATYFLTGNPEDIRALTVAAGYHYAYDREHDQFAHLAVAFVITAQGRIARVLSGLGLDGRDLRLALVEAGRGHVGSIVDRLHLLCYGFDPTRGIYTAAIARWLEIGGALTVLLLGGGIAMMLRQGQGVKST